MSSLGTAKFKNVAMFLDWYHKMTIEEAQSLLMKYLPLEVANDPIQNHLKEMLEAESVAFQMIRFTQKQAEASWAKQKAAYTVTIQKLTSYAHQYGQPLHVLKWHEGSYAALYIGNPNKLIIVPCPEAHLEFTPDKDYAMKTPSAVRAELGAYGDIGGVALLPAGAEAGMTQYTVRKSLDAQEAALSNLEKEIDDVRYARTGKSADIKKQMDDLQTKLDAQRNELMAQLQEKKREMEQMKEQMEGQIYLLDSQIYAIRCYAGEIVQFTQIRTGKKALDREPIIIHQKLRFLDEELGRLASLYELQWDNISLFEEFLRHSPLALDTFAPDERCVVLVRVSRTGKQQGRDDRLPYSNLLTDFEFFHGQTVGIIIRNGENLYLGWTDEDRVHINDDLIISQVIETSAPAPDFHSSIEEERWAEIEKEERRKILDGLISRSFIYNILQGIVDHTPILPLPDGVKLSKQSEYVIYSLADKWLSDNRFPSFDDIVQRCNAKVVKGDMLLTVQSLVPERPLGQPWANKWENIRGRGEKNRTHDCRVKDCSIYPANLVEYDEPVTMVRYLYGGREYSILKKDAHLDPDTNILGEYEERCRHVFISVEKQDSAAYTTKRARANFEIHEYEFINLTYMNSTWLEWVITNKTLGGWSIRRHPVDYAYAIRYLKTALEFIREREAQERSLLDAADPGICKDPDWPLHLSEWKLSTGVRNITEFQAKRFAAAKSTDSKG